MNGLSDDAAICSGVYYRKANQLIVPKNALVNGTTYELQVQAIDLMGEHSPMTKPVEVTYNAEKTIAMDDSPVKLTDWNYYFMYADAIDKNFTTDQQELHMAAMILPTYATFNKVNWSIASGGEYASISQSGLLTAKGGKGDVVVRVVTLDGSNLSNEITIPCDVNVLAQDIDVRAAKKSVEVGSYLLLNAVLTPKNTTMSNVTWKSEDTTIATVDESGILKALSTGVVKVTATTKDGSNLSAYITITVVNSTGIKVVTLDGNNADLIYFDLEGRKVKTPKKGHIYITNKGEKIAF